MTTDTKDAQVQIRRGLFEAQYLIYSRKSTDEAEHQKNSLLYQGSENCRFAQRQGIRIADISVPGFCTNGVIAEKHSGFKETDELEIKPDGRVQFKIDRPKFQQLLGYLNKGHFRGVVCLCWDRISRNRSDDAVIRKLMRRGVDIRFVYANYDQSSAGELHMDIDGMFAQHHSRVTSEKVRMATRAKREEGKCTYRAPIGYLNTGSMDHKPFDPERAPLVKEMFELYASGDWSLHDLARHMRRQGLTTPPMRKKRTREEMLADDGEDLQDRPKVSHPIGYNRIQKILVNPFYVGMIKNPEGLPIPSTSHEPLIDKATFERVQQKLATKRVSTHYTTKLDLPFRGFLRCAQCGRTYTPYTKKGHLYFGARCAKACGNKRRNCNLNFVLGEIRALMASIEFTKEELAQIDAAADTQIALLTERQRKNEREVARRRSRLTNDLDYLRSNQLTLLQSGVYDPASLANERARLETEIDELHHESELSEQSMRDLVKDVVKVSELLNSVVVLIKMATPEEMERIVKILSVELLLDQNTAVFSPQIGLAPIIARKNSSCAQPEWFSELFSDNGSSVRRLLAQLRATL